IRAEGSEEGFFPKFLAASDSGKLSLRLSNFPDAARGIGLERAALQEVFPNLRSAHASWNNYISLWYNPFATPTAPDAGEGFFDWLETGRLGGLDPLASDWFPDQQAEDWSVYADALRSAAMLGTDTEFSGYVVGRKLGDVPAGASYKILSLLGHGAKAVNLYSFGPEVFAPNDSWSDHFNVYGPIADALRLVGPSQHVLYPGQPERGKVALLLPNTSHLWDSSPLRTQYQQEIWGLDFALTHAGYTVDFVDDTDLAQGELPRRGYTTLYLTGPNLAAAAQEQVRDWVNQGGTLVVTDGAAVADEYNTPTTILDSVLGLQPRSAARDLMSELPP